MSTQQPEALRLAVDLEAFFISEEVHATKARAIAAELRRLHARVQDLQAELVKEASRTAEEKLRADQMTEQHRMQAAMHSEARHALTQQERKPLTDEQIRGRYEQKHREWLAALVLDENQKAAKRCKASKDRDFVLWLSGVRHAERAHGIQEKQG